MTAPAMQWTARADWIDAEDGTVVCLRPRKLGFDGAASDAKWPERRALIAAAPAMLEALKGACEQFLFYAAQYDAKGTPESAIKARVNRDKAEMCRAAIIAAEGR